MGHHQNHQINQAPAVSLDSADYLTNKKTLKEYQKIQVDHLHHPSWLGRLAQRPGARRLARDLVRLIMLLLALGVGAALVYFLEQDASLALGE
jgi:hypothetical protein